MISPDYVQATGIPTFKLESPVRLQLTCVGSKSTISYGARSSIVFGNKHVEEYFDMANIDYYDVILGTLSRIITASILHFKEHTTYCLRLSTATGT